MDYGELEYDLDPPDACVEADTVIFTGPRGDAFFNPSPGALSPLWCKERDPVAACSGHTTCGACVADYCGFCADDQTCVYGDARGPMDRACTDWRYSADSCE
jgi:hypothetical protein